MIPLDGAPFERPRRPALELLADEDMASTTLSDAEHWLDTYTELLRNEEWLLDDRLPEANILRMRLDRINRLRERQEFWRARREALARTQ